MLKSYFIKEYLMNKELSQYLTRKYSKIFPKKTNYSKEYLYSFECNDGWFTIINNCLMNIQSHIDYTNSHYDEMQGYKKLIETKNFQDLPEWVKMSIDNGNFNADNIAGPCLQLVASQIKEKFGSLNFYYNGGDDFCKGVIETTKSLSLSTCEICGYPGKMYSNGYVQTLCEKHAKEYDKKLLTSLKGDKKFLMNRALMEDGMHEVSVIQQISETEVICKNKNNIMIHAIKIVTEKNKYWLGELLEE